jgi:type I restriction enzyme M protein
MKRSLGNKRNEIAPAQIDEITRCYCDFQDGPRCKIFDNADFGYTRITVERPQRDENGKPLLKKGQPQADSSLRDFENVPLKTDIADYFRREVLPHAPDAWIEGSKSQVGYEVNFTRYFYEYKPLRSLEAIRADILALEAANQNSLLKAIEL